jgi:hypothetical protein
MRCFNYRTAAIALVSSILIIAGCSSSEKPADKTKLSDLPGEGTTAVSVQQGEAGGIVLNTYNIVATVSDIDKSSRKITVTGTDGTKATFKAGPDVRNFDQLHVGDKVNATVAERVVVFVRSGNTVPSSEQTTAVAVAPKGAKPGVVAVDAQEVVATVKSIDTAARKATLQFSDGETRTVAVRPDVDLQKYKVGDSVVIRITTALAVTVEKQ